ncbi:hypothetical protein FBU31_007202 [Coemansia sp. 'formosensis']|nr:hypothetical protein FBU31_007202 [Coemansia sp. 'formosensis']
MTISKDFWLQLTTPLFADSLVSLTLEGEYGQDTVENFLQLFPNLHRLRVCAIFSEPIFSVSDLICEYSLMCIRRPLKPLNSSLCILEAYGVRLFSDCDDLDFTPKRLRLMAPELYHYRGILVGLLYRLPALDTLRVGAPSVDGVNEDIDAIVATNVCPEHINRLQRLRIRPLDY